MFEPESEVNIESLHTEKYHQNACRIALVLAHKWKRKNFRFNVTDRGNETDIRHLNSKPLSGNRERYFDIIKQLEYSKESCFVFGIEEGEPG